MLNFATNNEAIQVDRPIPFLADNIIYKGYDVIAKSKVTKQERICQVSDCNTKHYGLGYCSKHYKQIKRTGKTYQSYLDPNIFEFIDNICLILLLDMQGATKGKAIIDREDYPKVKDMKWRLSGNGYVMSGAKKQQVYLHRIVFVDLPDGVIVDHKDMDLMNNRKSNLRASTRSQNGANSKITKSNRSGFKGVYLPSDKKKFVARIQAHGIPYNLGYFDNKIDAAKAYDKKAVEVFGEFAATNEMLGLL
jgi:hypothetical protein